MGFCMDSNSFPFTCLAWSWNCFRSYDQKRYHELLLSSLSFEENKKLNSYFFLKKNEGKLEELKDMYNQWPFFRSTIDLIQMVLFKADPLIAQHYYKTLAPSDLQVHFLFFFSSSFLCKN